jgi:Leucine-rich repeat (LRR) protein
MRTTLSTYLFSKNLSMININICKLLNLPQLKNLLILDVSRNHIRDVNVHFIPETYPNLEELNLSDNMIFKGYTF